MDKSDLKRKIWDLLQTSFTPCLANWQIERLIFGGYISDGKFYVDQALEALAKEGKIIGASQGHNQWAYLETRLCTEGFYYQSCDRL